jgi:hypothetical protein
MEGKTETPHLILETTPDVLSGNSVCKNERYPLTDFFESGVERNITQTAQNIVKSLLHFVDTSSLTIPSEEGMGPVFARMQNELTGYLVHSRATDAYEQVHNMVTAMFIPALTGKLRQQKVGYREQDVCALCKSVLDKLFNASRRAGVKAEVEYIRARAKEVGILEGGIPALDSEKIVRILGNTRLDAEHEVDVLEAEIAPGDLAPKAVSLRLVQIKSYTCDADEIERIHSEHKGFALHCREYPLPIFDIESQRRNDDERRKAHAFARSEFFELLELVQSDDDVDSLLREHMTTWPEDNDVLFYTELQEKLLPICDGPMEKLYNRITNVLNTLQKKKNTGSHAVRHEVPVPLTNIVSVVKHGGGVSVRDVTPQRHDGADYGVMYEDTQS